MEEILIMYAESVPNIFYGLPKQDVMWLTSEFAVPDKLPKFHLNGIKQVSNKGLVQGIHGATPQPQTSITRYVRSKAKT